MLINKRECVGSNHCNDPKAFIEYSNDMDDIYTNINQYNSGKTQKRLIVFVYMIADIYLKINSVVTEPSIRGKKLNISFVFNTQSNFNETKDVRLNSMHFFIMKILNHRELQ